VSGPTGAATTDKENIMNTKPNRKKLVTSALGAAAAAVAVPAVLFAGTGTAEAADVNWAPGVSIGIPTNASVEVTVTDNTNGAPGQWGSCLYTSTPELGVAAVATKLTGVPPLTHPFVLPKGHSAYFTIGNDGELPAIMTGSLWHVHIECTSLGQTGTAYDSTEVLY
jgi:hypothetical protein